MGKRGKCKCGQSILIEELPIAAAVDLTPPPIPPPITSPVVPVQQEDLPTPTSEIPTAEKPKGFWATMKDAAAKASDAAKRDNPVIYVSGPFDLKANSPGTLRLEDDRLLFKSPILRRDLFSVPYDAITEATVDTAERMTVMRVLALGIFAFGFKKKDRFLKLDFRDETELSVTVVFGKANFGPDMDKLGGTILSQRRTSMGNRPKESPQTTVPMTTTTPPIEDVTATLEKLAALRDKGILTDDEFQKKKSEILSRL